MSLLVRFLLLFVPFQYETNVPDDDFGFMTQPYKILFGRRYNIGNSFPDTPEHWNCRCVSTLEEVDEMRIEDLKLEVEREKQAKSQRPWLKLVIANEFGDIRIVSTTLISDSMDEVYPALRQALMGCGYSEKTVEEWLPEQV